MLTKYNLKMPHEIFSGEDALENLKTILQANGVKKVAVFTDKGIQGAGLLASGGSWRCWPGTSWIWASSPGRRGRFRG